MGKSPRKHSAEFKAKVVLELFKEYATLPQICSKYQIHPTQARRWKEEAIAGLIRTFSDRPNTALAEQQHLTDELYKQIGQLNVQLDWLKKKTGLSP